MKTLGITAILLASALSAASIAHAGGETRSKANGRATVRPYKAPAPILPPAPADVCSCSTNECVESFVESHFGCGTCATFTCEQGVLHACVACPAPSTSVSKLRKKPGRTTY